MVLGLLLGLGQGSVALRLYPAPHRRQHHAECCPVTQSCRASPLMFFASQADSTMAGAKDAPDVYISLSWPIGDAECIRRPLTAGDMKLLRS